MIGMIWAQARNRAIGKNNTVPWHVPEDLAFFKRVTHGRPVLMGRKTWESLDAKYRPLPGRTNVVITRQEGYVADGAVVVSSIDDAIATLANTTDVMWVIGGGQIYTDAMPLADFVVMTHLDIDVPDADAFAPAIPLGWNIASVDPTRGWTESTSGIPYRFMVYTRPGVKLPESLDLPG